jgi:hypothetical protein
MVMDMVFNATFHNISSQKAIDLLYITDKLYGRGFSPITPFSSTNKTDLHDITEWY